MCGMAWGPTVVTRVKSVNMLLIAQFWAAAPPSSVVRATRAASIMGVNRRELSAQTQGLNPPVETL